MDTPRTRQRGLGKDVVLPLLLAVEVVALEIRLADMQPLAAQVGGEQKKPRPRRK